MVILWTHIAKEQQKLRHPADLASGLYFHQKADEVAVRALEALGHGELLWVYGRQGLNGVDIHHR